MRLHRHALTSTLAVFLGLTVMGCAEELPGLSTPSQDPDFSLRMDVRDAATLLPVIDATPGMGNNPLDQTEAGRMSPPPRDAGSTTDGPSLPARCGEDNDCAANERCVNQRCVPDGEQPDPCQGVNCPSGFACEDGDCVYQGCQDDADCPQGQRCLNEECVEPPDDDSPCGFCPEPRFCVGNLCAQCRGDNDCLNGFECVDFNCRLREPPPDECRIDADCDAEEICRLGRCEPDPEASPCGFCPMPRFCIGPRCAECEDDDDCPEALRCRDLLCILDGPGPAGCIENDDCPGGVCINRQCQGAPVEDDACMSPTAYELGALVRGDTSQASSTHTGSCSLNADAPERVYSFIADLNGPICVTTNGSAYNTNLYIRAVDCENGQEPQGACNINNGTSSTNGRLAMLNVNSPSDSTLHFEATAGTRYFIFVDGWHRASGQFVLSTQPGWCERGNPPPMP